MDDVCSSSGLVVVCPILSPRMFSAQSRLFDAAAADAVGMMGIKRRTGRNDVTT